MPRPDVSGERRSRILDAALSVFSRLGFHTARMDDIAEEAALSKGALYLCYKSKDAIIGAILHYFFEHTMRPQRPLQASERSVHEQIHSYFETVARESERMARLSPIAFEFCAVAGRQVVVRQRLREYFVEFRDVVAALIRRGIEQGEFRAVNPEETAYTHCALFEGLNLLLLVESQHEQWRQHAAASVELLLDGIAAK